MAESKKHRQAAERIARKHNTSYNKGKGPDIKTNKVTVEVETERTVSDAIRQLKGHRGRCYVAGADNKATQAALEKMKDTTIGVMDSEGKILRKSTRK